MIITFFTKDGQFTTDKFKSVEDAKEYLDESIYPIMVEDIQSVGQKRAAIFIPNGQISIFGPNSKLTTKKIESNKARYTRDIPESEKTFYDDLDDEGMKFFNLEMLKYMAITPEQEEDERDKAALEDGEMDKMAYNYFLKNIDRLYNNPEWIDFKIRYDSEKLK